MITCRDAREVNVASCQHLEIISIITHHLMHKTVQTYADHTRISLKKKKGFHYSCLTSKANNSVRCRTDKTFNTFNYFNVTKAYNLCSAFFLAQLQYCFLTQQQHETAKHKNRKYKQSSTNQEPNTNKPNLILIVF